MRCKIGSKSLSKVDAYTCVAPYVLKTLKGLHFEWDLQKRLKGIWLENWRCYFFISLI
jgi:hypothetical protein